ncbi:hypothetical protein ASH01_09105 [Terrabacter sp. Soil811]|uniref:DUF1648 domain-containing protein n=1 Tax=Terrabacter sp. Soil811 TaxID=1736419 RepID=UPI0006FF0EA6|nr:DUF1648 domain-containing protein [Terrabacter sp. Soil811]KRF45923.1 hypothetical protein ASH01_09105 [Terrabacter sp. Soil811]
MTTDRRPTHALVASAVLAPVVAAVGTGLAYAVRDLVPDPVAVHWGLDGEPDRWQPFGAAVVTAAVITTVMPLALVGLGALMHRSARGPLAAVAGGLAVFLGGVLFGGLLAQRPGQVPQAFPPQWAVPTLVLTALVAVGLWRWGRTTPPEVTGARAPLPADAPRLDVTPTTRLAWTGRASLRVGPTAALAVVVALPLVWVALAGFAWVWLLALALGALLALTLSARVTVDASGLRVSSAGLSWSRVPLERVASAGTTTVSPLREFGGWGWRIGVDGRRGYVTRAGEALVVHRVGEPDVVVTVDDADEAAAVLNTLAARVG